MSYLAYVFPLVARDERELEWMAKGFLLDAPHQYLNVPRLFAPTARYELLMRDDEGRRLFYWFKDFQAFLPTVSEDMFDAAMVANGALSDPGSALAEPVPLDGVPLPRWRFAPNASSESRIPPRPSS